MNMSIHHAQNVRLVSTYAANSNSVTLEIVTKEGTHEITIYDLPERVTDKLLVLSDRSTTHHTQDEED